MTEKALKPIKPFLNYEEQINNLIEQKGMIVNDFLSCHHWTIREIINRSIQKEKLWK